MSRSPISVILFALLLALLAPALAFAQTPAPTPVHFGYEGDIGPASWGKLSPDYATCANGKEQSPVDIPASAPVNPAADIVFNYQPSKVNIVNNGHAIQVNYDPGSTIQVKGVTYTLAQFHFHGLSEHTLAGKQSDMELHLVHRAADGKVAVVGVMLKNGAENAAYAPVFNNMPSQEGEPKTVANATVNAKDLLPTDRSYYRYNGSLTTPPCTEGVSWFVMKNPVEVSQAQTAAFQKIYKNNFRPVQPMNARTFLTTASLPAAQPAATVQPAAAAGAAAQATPAATGAAPAALPKTGAFFPPAAGLAGLALLFGAAGLAVRRRNK